jgi:pimeloyl-ACP methyl ester carboxylesterase
LLQIIRYLEQNMNKQAKKSTEIESEQYSGDQEWHPRLRPEDAAARRIRGAMGLLLAYPWFDRVSLWTLTHYFFPLSRLWASATVSEGVPEKFLSEIPLDPGDIDLDRVQSVLFPTEAKRATAAAVDSVWEESFFGHEPRTVEELVAIETARRDHHHALNVMRRKFRFLLKHPVPITRTETPSPDEVAKKYGAALSNRTPFFSAPDPMPQMQISRRVPGAVGTDFWIRFKSPSMVLADTVYARVSEPEGIKDPPTLIFGHGICVEFDHWHGLVDEVETLVRMGIRVVRPEAPWHGRRRPAGYFSGEKIVGTAPFGGLHAFTGALREWSVLIDWARHTSTGKIAVGGSSLGAQMSMLCADISRDWPKALRPEAMLLLTHAGNQQDALLKGALAKAWKSREAMMAKGWTFETSGQYMPILDPNLELPPIMPPQNIVSVLGKYDHVTPFDSGYNLLNAWQVPQVNRFIWRRGHFSVPMTMIRDTKPLNRFVEIMKRQRD